MTVRDTSIDAYKKLQDMGYLKGYQEKVYDKLFEHGPMTSAECYQMIPEIHGDQQGNIRARIHELYSYGLVAPNGKRRCSITKNTVTLWDVTSHAPDKLEKKKTKGEIHKAIVKELHEEIEELQTENRVLLKSSPTSISKEKTDEILSDLRTLYKSSPTDIRLSIKKIAEKVKVL